MVGGKKNKTFLLVGGGAAILVLFIMFYKHYEGFGSYKEMRARFHNNVNERRTKAPAPRKGPDVTGGGWSSTD